VFECHEKKSKLYEGVSSILKTEIMIPHQHTYRFLSCIVSGAHKFTTVNSTKTILRSILLPKHVRAFSSSPLLEASLLSQSPQKFLEYLKEHNIQRAYIVYDDKNGTPKVSHPELQELSNFFAADKVDFRQHEGVFLSVGARTQCLMGAFVWNTCRGQACGGIRLWQYQNMEQYLRDGLRLAFGMGVKSALAGLWAGGGKGVVAEPEGKQHVDPLFRQQLFYDYGDFLTSLNGCYVAAEDVGLTVSDLNYVHEHTRYTTCIAESLGGSGNPSVATGQGVVCAMEGALDFLNQGTLEGKTIAIQGGGNVGIVIIEGLLERNVKHIHVTDCHKHRIDGLKYLFPNAGDKMSLELVPINDTSIMSYPCDILSPCALGNVINADTIPSIKASIICGAANNQLGSEKDNTLLSKNGITYIPDFLANRMGIVNCANEAYGRLPSDPAISRHFGREWKNSIFEMVRTILEKASSEGTTPATAATELAEELSRELHPIWPRRNQQIIKHLTESDWKHGKDYWNVE